MRDGQSVRLGGTVLTTHLYHAEFFDLATKRKRLDAGDALAFVDPQELPRRIARAEAGFKVDLAKEQAARR